MRKEGFFKLLLRLAISGYSDITVCEMNRTRTVRFLVALTKPVGWLFPLRNNSGLFFFFPFFHVGGAEKVHAEIVACLSDRMPWVVFTKKSANNAFRPLFAGGARLFNLWPFCKYLYPLSVGVTAGFINRHRNSVVFGANSLFFSLLVPYLKPEVRCIDLIHAFGGGVENFTIFAAPRLDARVVINRKTIEDLEGQYARHGLEPSLAERIMLIGNATRIPADFPEKSATGELVVLYVGRASEEKRVHLVGRAARLCREKGGTARFVLIGDVREAIPTADRVYCEFVGEVTDASELEALYRQAHVLIIASSREGFPMTVMEAMANGVVPVCTAVGGIPEHVRHGETGLLVECSGEEEVANALADSIVMLGRDRMMFDCLSRAAHVYAQAHFSRDDFCAAYRRLMQGRQIWKTRGPCQKLA